MNTNRLEAGNSLDLTTTIHSTDTSITASFKAIASNQPICNPISSMTARRSASYSSRGSQSPQARRTWGLPNSILLVFAISRLNNSAFLASAHYIEARNPISSMSNRTIQMIHKRDQSSSSREIAISSFDDFCLFGPPDPFNYVWSSGLNVVSWCTKNGHGTRLIPDGTLHGVTYVKTNDYVQVSGTGDLTKINWAPGDVGGQFDSAENMPQGASLKINGQSPSDWVTLISAATFCLRACTGDPKFCSHEYNQMGCWFLTGNAVGSDGTWQNCESDSGEPPGVINGKTYAQTDPNIPDPTAPDLRACQPGPSVSNGQAPPPLFPWNGQPGGNDQPNSQGSGERPGPSTIWLPVETCQPCNQQPNSAPSTSSAAGGGGGGGGLTEQIGITQVKSDAVVAVATDGPGSSASSMASVKGSTTSLAPFNDQLNRRQAAETVTKNGQCCHTTWTPSVVGGAGPTTTGSHISQTGQTSHQSQSGTVSGVGSRVPVGTGSVSASASGTVGGIVPSGSTGIRPSGSGGLVSGNNTNTTSGNGTGNDTTNGTGAAIRATFSPLGDLRGLMGCTLAALIAGVAGLGFVA